MQSCGFEASRAGLDSDLVVYGLSQSLFTTEIFFSGLHRDVAQQKLNLFQLAPRAVAEAGTRSSKITGREFYNSYLARILFDEVPHDFFSHFGAPNRSHPTHAT